MLDLIMPRVEVALLRVCVCVSLLTGTHSLASFIVLSLKIGHFSIYLLLLCKIYYI